MKGWQIISPKTVKEETFTEVFDSVSSAKIKLTKALANENDIQMFGGEMASALPVVSGSFGVGVVVETGENCFGLEKNNRVYINPFTVCQTCPGCKGGNPSYCPDLKAAGEDFDGFLRDFAIFPCASLYVLPENVSDQDAVFIDYISLAVSIVDRLQIQKGDHVAVIGANTLGNILSQLIIYYQGVPILIDSDLKALESARQAGVYYTLETGANLLKSVSELTSARLADKVVFTCSPTTETSLSLQMASFGASIAYAGFDYSNLSVNLKHAMRRQLNLITVTNGVGNIATSINLLANKAVNLAAVRKNTAKYADIPAVFAEMYENYKLSKKFLPILVDLM